MYRDSIYTFKVGVMVAIGLVVLAILIYLTGDIRLYQPGYTITIIFDNVEGLDVNSPVRLAGMEVGEVREMRVKDGKIHVKAWLKKEARIYQDTEATINSMGLIGEKYLGLTMGKRGPYLENGAVIIGKNPISVGEMLSKGEKVIERVEGTVGALEKILTKAEIIEDIKEILKNINEFSNGLNRLLQENKRGISASLKDLHRSTREFSQTTEEFRIATREVSARLKRILQELDKGLENKGEDIGRIINNLKEVSNRLNLSTESLAKIIQQIEKGEGTAGKILFDKGMANNLAAAIKDLRVLAEDLKAHPWKLVRKK